MQTIWPRNPVKVLFIPITEAQMDELISLAEQGAIGIDGFLGWYIFAGLPNRIEYYSRKNLYQQGDSST